MNTRNGTTSKSQHMLNVLTVPCGNGADAGTKAKAWRTCPDRERQGVFPSEVRAQATALACSLPKEKGVPLSRWSLAEIVKHLLSLQTVSAISISTLFRWFAADKLKPWRFHNWQHILDPQKFLERARPVLQVYEMAGGTASRRHLGSLCG